jgi:hypothetical protein
MVEPIAAIRMIKSKQTRKTAKLITPSFLPLAFHAIATDKVD